MTALAHTTDSPSVGTGNDSSRELIRGSVWVILSVVVGAMTSAAFWLLAARLHPSSDVGRASGLFTSVLFVCFVCGLGLPVAMSRFAGQPRRSSTSLFTWVLLVSAATSSVGAIVYLNVVDSPSADVVVRLGWRGSAVFAATAAGGALTLLVDVRLMAARRWGCMFARVLAVGVCQLGLLVSFDAIAATDLWLFVAAAGPIAASGFLGVTILPRLIGDGYRMRPTPTDAGSVLRFASVNYVATLASEGPRFVLPVLVLVNVAPSTNANFYVAWSVVAVAMLVPTTLGQVLLVEGSRGDAAPIQPVIAVAAVGAGAMACCWLAAFALQRLVPLLYGPDYRSAGRLLPVLLAAGVPWALTSVALADARVRQDHWATLLTTFVLSASVLAPAAVLVPRYGLAGASWPWVFGNLIAASVGLYFLWTRRMSAAPRDGFATLRDPG